MADASCSALMSFLLAKPILGLLAQQGMLTCFQDLEMPTFCTLAAAAAAAWGLNFHNQCMDVDRADLVAMSTNAKRELSETLGCTVDLSTAEGINNVLVKLNVHLPDAIYRGGKARADWRQRVISALEAVINEGNNSKCWGCEGCCLGLMLQCLSAQEAMVKLNAVQTSEVPNMVSPTVWSAMPSFTLVHEPRSLQNMLETVELWNMSMKRITTSLEDELNRDLVDSAVFDKDPLLVAVDWSADGVQVQLPRDGESTSSPLRLAWLHRIAPRGPQVRLFVDGDVDFGAQRKWLALVSIAIPQTAHNDGLHMSIGPELTLVPTQRVWRLIDSSSSSCCSSLLGCRIRIPGSHRGLQDGMDNGAGGQLTVAFMGVTTFSLGTYAHPSSPSRVFISCTHWWLEISILAHLSGDNTLVDAIASGKPLEFMNKVEALAPFRDACSGLTRTCGMGLLQTCQGSTSLVVEPVRCAMKVLHALVSGWSPQHLGNCLGVPRRQALKLTDAMLDSLPGVKDFHDGLLAQGRKKGFVDQPEQDYSLFKPSSDPFDKLPFVLRLVGQSLSPNLHCTAPFTSFALLRLWLMDSSRGFQCFLDRCHDAFDFETMLQLTNKYVEKAALSVFKPYCRPQYCLHLW